MDNPSPVSGTDTSSTVRAESVVEVTPTEPDQPLEARTLVCNGPSCGIEVFGDMRVYSTKCCYNIICELCVARAQRAGSLCPISNCRAPLDTVGSLFLSDDPSEIESKERDIYRSLMLKSTPRYQEIVEDGKLLEAKAAMQKEQIEGHNRLHSILADQIVQSSDRVEAVTHESDACKEAIQQMVSQTQKVLAANDALRAKIDDVTSKKNAITSRIASIRTDSKASIS